MQNKSTNKVVAWGLICTLAVAVLTAMSALPEIWYNIAGIAFWVFGIWAAVKLLK